MAWTNRGSVRFAWEMLWARFDPERRGCPYCHSRYSSHLQTKKVFIQARMCVYCGLIFRYPTDKPEKARRYYEQQYDERLAADLPSEGELQSLLARAFKNSAFDKSSRVALLKSLR